MLRPVGFMVLLTALTASAAPADVAPARIVPREPLISWSMVELRHAQVDISVQRIDPARLTDTTGAPAPPSADARVECGFELYLAAGDPPRQPCPMAFPVSRCTDPAIQATDLSVRIDSVEIKDITYTKDLRYPPDWGSYWGYRWSAEVQVQRALQVRVSYVVHLDMSQGAAFFRYVLRSGSVWTAPIGSESVTLRHGAGLAIRPLAARTLRPRVRGDTIRWELQCVRPTEDVELYVCPAEVCR